MTAEYVVRRYVAADGPEAHRVLDTAFGMNRPDSWFRWKHESGPWGSSVGWVAEDAHGLVAVRLFTPWRWRLGGTEFEGYRALDGAVHQRARRRGLFSALVRRETEPLEHSPRRFLIVSTSVPESRAAYEKLGWDVHPPVSCSFTMSRPNRSALVESAGAPSASVAIAPSEVLSTAWTKEALEWRFRPESGHDYVTVALRNGGSAGLVGRRVAGRFPRFAIGYAWGQREELNVLLGAAAYRYRVPGAWWSGTPAAGHTLASRPGSSLSTLSTGDDPLRIDTNLLSWPFADAEGVL